MVVDHRRGLRLAALLLCVVWIATMAQAATAVTPAMHCQRHMPCCPQGTNGESCSTARCTEQFPEKTEAQIERAPQNEGRAALPAFRDGAAMLAIAVPVWAQAAGLKFRAAVFHLKDDLRI